MALNEPKEITCPSGAILKIQVAPFIDAKNLYQVLLRELRDVNVGGGLEMSSLYKDLFCLGFSSQAIEKCLEKCFERCTYNGLKIDRDTFEPVEARDDYMVVCMEVAKENVAPFGKSLFAEYKRISAIVAKDQM